MPNLRASKHRRSFSPQSRSRQVTHGSRDIDPRPMAFINVYFSFKIFVCSRCQVGLKGNRAMGAYITNKHFFWHTLLPQNLMCILLYSLEFSPVSFSRCLKSSEGVLMPVKLFGTRDIDPSLELIVYVIRTAVQHTMLPLNEFLKPKFLDSDNIVNFDLGTIIMSISEMDHKSLARGPSPDVKWHTLLNRSDDLSTSAPLVTLVFMHIFGPELGILTQASFLKLKRLMFLFPLHMIHCQLADPHHKLFFFQISFPITKLKDSGTQSGTSIIPRQFPASTIQTETNAPGWTTNGKLSN